MEFSSHRSGHISGPYSLCPVMFIADPLFVTIINLYATVPPKTDPLSCDRVVPLSGKDQEVVVYETKGALTFKRLSRGPVDKRSRCRNYKLVHRHSTVDRSITRGLCRRNNRQETAESVVSCCVAD